MALFIFFKTVEIRLSIVNLLLRVTFFEYKHSHSMKENVHNLLIFAYRREWRNILWHHNISPPSCNKTTLSFNYLQIRVNQEDDTWKTKWRRNNWLETRTVKSFGTVQKPHSPAPPINYSGQTTLPELVVVELYCWITKPFAVTSGRIKTTLHPSAMLD